MMKIIAIFMCFRIVFSWSIETYGGFEQNCFSGQICANLSNEADRIQCIGYDSSDHSGTCYYMPDFEKAMNNGLIITSGYACETRCKSWGYWNTHYCGNYKCALYNKDQYGRECIDIRKSVRNTWCKVKHSSSIFSGSYWGWTHPPVLKSSKTKCILEID